jgi:hypothetical protein
MANLVKRSGIVKIRVGGNTQENAVLVDSLDNGKVLEKQLIGGSVGLASLSLLTGCWSLIPVLFYFFLVAENACFDVHP